MSDEANLTHPPPDEIPSDHPNWRQWTWWLRPIVALPLMLLVLLLLSPFLVRGWHLAKVPDIADPFDVEAFLSETVDDKDNAFVDYNAAAALLVPSTFSHEEFDAGWEKASPPLRLWMDTNRPALDRWRSGTEKVDAIDGDLRDPNRLDSLPNVTESREFLRLASLQGERDQSEGHTAEAWQWYRAVMRFSRHLGRRTESAGRNVGCAFHNMTAARIERWASDPRPSADELKVALSQLTEDFRLTRPFSELLKVEYCSIWKLARAREEWKFRSPFSTGSPDWRYSRPIRYCLGEPDLTVRLNKLVIENWLFASDVARRFQRQISSTRGCVLDVTAPGSRVSGMELLRLIEASRIDRLPDFGRTRDSLDSELARHDALRLTLACQIWFRRNHAFPANLEDLVPDVLAELPVDPFSQTGEVFRYRRDGDEAVVYSLGFDETDDHGSVDLIPGIGYSDIGYRIEPPRIREQASEQKPVDEP